MRVPILRYSAGWHRQQQHWQGWNQSGITAVFLSVPRKTRALFLPPASPFPTDTRWVELIVCFSIFMLYVAWKRGLPRKFARFVLLRLINKRSFNLLCVSDLLSSTFKHIFLRNIAWSLEWLGWDFTNTTHIRVQMLRYRLALIAVDWMNAVIF